MGLFDIFTTDAADKAARDQISGINTGYDLASGSIGKGIDTLKSGYSAALDPYLKNFSTAQGGVQQLGNVLGLNGQGGSDAALAALRNTPGYKFQQQTLDDTVNAQAAASGMNASGNQLLALNKQNQGLADSTYDKYVSQLQPFLGAANSAAGGIAGVNTGMSNAIAGQYDSLANLGWQKGTGIGNANANADLAANTASGNIWNMIGKLGGSALGGIGGMGGGGGVPGAVGATSLGGAPLAGGGGIGSLLAMFSDERLKEEIEPVGELYDGTGVYRYRYKGDDTPRIGLIAQEVEKTNPGAVVEIGGYKAVDYKKATQYASELSRFLEAA